MTNSSYEDKTHWSEEKEVIKSNMDLLTNIAEYLLKVETLTKPDIDEIESTGHLKWCDDEESRKASNTDKAKEEIVENNVDEKETTNNQEIETNPENANNEAQPEENKKVIFLVLSEHIARYRIKYRYEKGSDS